MKDIIRIVRFTGSLWRYYLGVSIFTLLIAGLQQLIPLLTKAAIDEIQHASHSSVDVHKVVLIAGLIFLTDFLQTIMSNLGGYIGDMLSIKQQQLLSQRYYERIMSLPQAYFDTELTGTIINRMSRGIQQITDYTQTLSNNFLQFIFSTIFTLIIVAFYSWQVALLLFALYPIYIWMTARSSGKWQGYQKQINQDLDLASGRFAESVSQVKVVKSFAKEAYELLFFNRVMQRVVRTTSPQSKYWHRNDVFRRSVLAVINLGIYGLIFAQTARGEYSIGVMVLLIQYAQLIRIPLFSISFLVDRTQRAIANSRDYFAVIDEQPEIADADDAVDLEVTDGKITFKNVTFAYPNGGTVLKKMNFVIPAHAKVALVGESGQGKTTITNLLLRLYKVSSGTITIDDHDISTVSQASLREQIAIVFQEPALFSGTIHENIAYARPDASMADIERAAKLANAHEFIETFEKGYESVVGERGVKLSGGQKQRIAIARALLKDAPILILDEATSSLDSKSEGLVQQALENLMQDRTTIIIAHRLSTIRSVDQIITIRDGKVDECGSPKELERSGGIYAQLLQLQRRTPDENRKQQLQAFEMADN